MMLPEPPRGMVEARVDDKGRLKIPVLVQEYLRKFGDSRFFITSLDGETGRLYPLSVWKSNENFLQKPGPHSKAAKQTLLLANFFGQEGDVDNQGRMLVPTNLRRKLGVEGGQVWLLCSRGQVTVFSGQKLEPAIEAALIGAPQAVEQLEASEEFL